MAQDLRERLARAALGPPEPRPFKSWPLPMSRLERMAFSLGVDDEELRGLLRAEVERRRVESRGKKSSPTA